MEFSICFWVCEEVLVHIKSAVFFSCLIWFKDPFKVIKERKRTFSTWHFSVQKTKTSHLCQTVRSTELFLTGSWKTKIMNNLVFWLWPLWISTGFSFFPFKVKSENSKSIVKWSTREPLVTQWLDACFSQYNHVVLEWNSNNTLTWKPIEIKHKRACKNYTLRKTSVQKTFLGNWIPWLYVSEWKHSKDIFTTCFYYCLLVFVCCFV